jgi:hypothetical protein
VTTTLDRQYFNGDGTNKIFPFNFSYFNSGQIYVWLVAADGTLTPQMLTTDYSLVGGLPVVAGTVTMVVAPPVGTRLLVRRVVAETQPTSIRNQGAFFPEIHEDVFDRLTMLLQQVSSNQSVGVDRAIRIPDTDLPIPTLPVAAARAGKLLSFDASGNPIAVLPDYDGVTGLAEALADDADALKGATLIGYEGGTVRVAIDNIRAYLLDLSNSADPAKGAALIGYNGAPLKTFLDSIASTAVVKNVATVAALRLLNPVGVGGAITSGYFAAGDEGAGVYYRDVADTTTADNGFTCIVGTVGSPGARWKLIYDGAPHIEQGGAKPDGVTSITAILNFMLATIGAGKIRFGVGPYLIDGNTDMPIGSSLIGIEGGGTLINYSGAGSFLLRSRTRVSGMRLECTGQTVGGWVFNILTSTAPVEYVTLEDLYLFNAKGVATDGNHASNLATNIRIRSVSSRVTKGPGFLFRDVFAFLEMRDVAVDYIGNVAAQNFVGFNIQNNEGCLLDNCEMTGTTGIVAGTNAGQIGFSFTSCKAVYLKRSFSDACGGRGMQFTTCQYVRTELCTNSLCDDVGFYFSGCTDVQITNHYVGGRRGLAGATAGIFGAYFLNCLRVMWGGINVQNASGDGLVTSGTGPLQLSNGIIYNCGGRGYITGTSSVSVASNVLTQSNASGNYSLATANDHMSGCQASSGGLLNVTGPGAA